MKDPLVLVDSCIWIDFFKGVSLPKLEAYIADDLVCTNELILTELLPFLQAADQKEIMDALQALPRIPIDIDWDVIRKLQMVNLQQGINKVGIPDLIITQQCIEMNLPLYSFDKHFKLMQPLFGFSLIETTVN